MRSNSARRVGSARVRITALILAASVMGYTLALANELVNANMFDAVLNLACVTVDL
jgi:hypothetical protein